MSVPASSAGRSSQKAVNIGNSSARSIPQSTASPRADKPLQLATYRTEVARAEEGHDFALQAGLEMHAEAGEAEFLRRLEPFKPLLP